MELPGKFERELGLAYKRVCEAGVNNKQKLKRFERKITEAEQKGFDARVYRNCLERLKKAARDTSVHEARKFGWG